MAALRPVQSRAMSMAEAIINVLIGFLITLGVQIVVYPAFGLKTTFGINLSIAGIFTFVSIVRSYVMRRVFERFH